MKEFSSETDYENPVSLTPSTPQSIQFTLDRSGIIVSTNDLCLIHLGYSSPDLIGRSISSLFHVRDGRIQVVGDVNEANLQPCHRELLASLQVRANLVVPIVSERQLWGLLIAQHCQDARQWYSSTIDLLKQLATQVGIAVQHAELLNRVQDINARLELQVQERTRKLQQILDFEKLVRKITEKVRDTLDFLRES